MKISKSIRDIYASKKDVYNKLQQSVDTILSQNKYATWHYFSRIKAEESFALKAETGRFYDLENLEDFFACTIVVENQSTIKKAIELIEKYFEIDYRKPKCDEITYNRADSFQFDDLRLYIKLKNDPSRAPNNIGDLVFEVQIKTFLQHAWGIATHDLVYKSDTVSWSTQRIAYQVKAMLEHAEISISEATKLSSCDALKKVDYRTKELDDMLHILRVLWPEDRLPKNVQGLANNIVDLIRKMRISIDDFKKIMTKEGELKRGAKLLNLSPYGSIVQSIINQRPDQFNKYLKGKTEKIKVLLTQEIEIPTNVQLNDKKNLLLVGFN